MTAEDQTSGIILQGQKTMWELTKIRSNRKTVKKNHNGKIQI